MESTADCWRYRCEGNRNVVVDNPAKRVIRRILKYAVKTDVQEAQCDLPILSQQTDEHETETSIAATADGTHEATGSSGRSFAAADAAASVGAPATQTTKIATACPTASNVEDLTAEVYATVRYYANVMKPLLHGYAIVPVPVTLDSHFIDRVLQNCSSLRPVERRGNLVGRSRACLELPDLCFLPGSFSSQSEQTPTIAVEVKIKCGTYVLRGADGRTCCMPCAQFRHRKMNGTVGHCRTADQPYCPLDLFSGNRERMLFALRTSLLDCRFCTNRMRIFKNGSYLRFDGQEKWSPEQYLAAVDEELSLFFGSDTANMTRCDSLLQLVVEAMLATPDGCVATKSSVAESVESPSSRREPALASGIVSIASSRTPERCCFSRFSFGDATLNGLDFQSETSDCRVDDGVPLCSLHRNTSTVADSHLPSGCLLDRLRTVQMLSCGTDVEELYRHCFLPLASYLKEYPAIAKRLFCFEPPYWDVAAENEALLGDAHCEPVMADRFVKVRNFLVAKTASDCSAMITLKPAHAAGERISVNGAEIGDGSEAGQEDRHRRTTFLLRDAAGAAYMCSVHVIDLDPKPMGKFPIYLEAYERCLSALSDVDDQRAAY